MRCSIWNLFRNFSRGKSNIRLDFLPSDCRLPVLITRAPEGPAEEKQKPGMWDDRARPSISLQNIDVQHALIPQSEAAYRSYLPLAFPTLDNARRAVHKADIKRTYRGCRIQSLATRVCDLSEKLDRRRRFGPNRILCDDLFDPKIAVKKKGRPPDRKSAQMPSHRILTK